MHILIDKIVGHRWLKCQTCVEPQCVHVRMSHADAEEGSESELEGPSRSSYDDPCQCAVFETLKRYRQIFKKHPCFKCLGSQGPRYVGSIWGRVHADKGVKPTAKHPTMSWRLYYIVILRELRRPTVRKKFWTCAVLVKHFFLTCADQL